MDKFSPARSTTTKGSRWSPGRASIGGGQRSGDTRDLIITQLKREINDIRASERDIVAVNSNLSSLEHRYRLLQDEKNIQDREFKAKSETNMKKVAQLKSELENCHRKLGSKNREYENLLNDLKEMEGLCNQKQQEIERFQARLKEYLEAKRQTEQDIVALRRKIKKETDTKIEASDRFHVSTKKMNDLFHQNKECEIEIAAQEEDIRIKLGQKAELQRSLEAKHKELAIATDIINSLTEQVDDVQQTILELEQEREARRKEREAINSQLATLDSKIKHSENENQDLEKRNHNLDVEIRKKNVQLAERQSEIRNLTHEQENLKRKNDFLRDDIEDMKTKIRELINLNREVVNTIADFNAEDEQIASELDYQVYPSRDLVNQSFRTASIH